jgi:hypothetical protein
MGVYDLRMDGLYDEKFGYIDIEKGPETVIGPGIFIHVFRKEFM